MTIKIVKEPDIHLTEAELARYRDEYRKMMMYYAGPPIPFETWVRQQIEAEKKFSDTKL